MSGEHSSIASDRIASALARLRSEARLNMVTRTLDEAALAQARDLDASPGGIARRGPLWGMPFVVKDNVALAGTAWMGGSPALEGLVADADAPIVARLKAAGMVPVAQANMHELALGITSNNAAFGAVANPADPSRMAGGSSGGTAAAIACGAVPAGVASDTGGSGRLPAALCGCVGYRPSVGRYPNEGLLTLTPTFDTASLMAVDVATVRAMDHAITGETPSASPKVADLVLGVARDVFWRSLHASVRDAAEAALDRLRANGATVVEIAMPGFEAAVEAAGFPIALHETKTVWTAFARERLGLDLATFAQRIASPDVAALFADLAAGNGPPAEAYRHAIEVARPAVRAGIAQAFETHGLDLLVHPTAPLMAPKLGDTETVELDGATVALFPAMTRNTLPTAIAGLPAITIPAGQQTNGLPFGLELVGRAASDGSVLAMAEALAALLMENR